MSTGHAVWLPREETPSRGSWLRSALGNVFFIALLLGSVLASWLWGPRFSVVLSQSMAPTIRPGDALVVVPWGSPDIGDIVQFRVPLAPGRAETVIPVAHRIVGQDERGYITKGDNPKANKDYWRLTPDMIEGYIVWWMPQVWMFRIAALLIGFAVLMLLWPAKEVYEDTA
jgi:signal peptidase I